MFADGACVEDPDAEGGGGKKDGKKSYCEKKGPTEADCLALKASKKCVWADEACVGKEDKKSCKGMKGKEKKKCKKCKGKKGKAKEKCECKGKKGKAKEKCKGKDSE